MERNRGDTDDEEREDGDGRQAKRDDSRNQTDRVCCLRRVLLDCGDDSGV